MLIKDLSARQNSHNPYFNRWFSAIITLVIVQEAFKMSQSLF